MYIDVDLYSMQNFLYYLKYIPLFVIIVLWKYYIEKFVHMWD